ncbi:ankyrin repeat domain-containing protein [Catellatospora sp. TT07R-123]|uniref:ankyrin repeat domain-containing protein n=1 Tax=Catellatospora sp. TT07R-123 TaxID=2733863 RepID=UPI001BB3F41C|nr:ankyrin repeat domain-containing protein [Catellatospora sp. TT07R-123]
MATSRRRTGPRPQPLRPATSVIAACTAARLAGDWEGACLAVGLRPVVDLALVEASWGEAAARELAESLAQLAPDLMQQYLRSDYRGWNSYATVVLTGESAAFLSIPRRPVPLPDGPVLALTGPVSKSEGVGAYLAVTTPDRLPSSWQALPVWCWRADAVDERREAYLSGREQARGDLEAFASGALDLADLHPLVFEALYPGEVQPRAEYTWDWPAVRVRCGRGWHRVQVADGRLALLDHTDDEIRRESALAALGGPVPGCVTVLRTWRSGQGRLPGELHRIRQPLFEYAFAGHTDVVVAMLDAGFDPAVADGNGRNLLHYLARLDGVRLLPRLLAAGLAVGGRDRHGVTALHLAAARRAGDLIAALVEAGAEPGTADGDDLPPAVEYPAWRYERAARVRIPARP